MRNYKVFDGKFNYSVKSLSDIHATIWDLLASKGFTDNQIVDIIDNQMWTEHDIHIMHNDTEVML